MQKYRQISKYSFHQVGSKANMSTKLTLTMQLKTIKILIYMERNLSKKKYRINYSHGVCNEKKNSNRIFIDSHSKTLVGRYLFINFTQACLWLGKDILSLLWKTKRTDITLYVPQWTQNFILYTRAFMRLYIPKTKACLRINSSLSKICFPLLTPSSNLLSNFIHQRLGFPRDSQHSDKERNTWSEVQLAKG